jgi:hypothetical protein
MKIQGGLHDLSSGVGLEIQLSGDEVCDAIVHWMETKGLRINGSRTVMVNGAFASNARIIVDPSASVVLSSPSRQITRTL